MSLRREELKDIDYRVPPELAQLILRFDGSILVDRAWGEVAGWCAAAAANVLGLHLVHELLTANPAWRRPGTSEQNTLAYHLGREAPSAERLLFEGPQGGLEDLDGSTRSGAVLQQMAGRRKDAVTGGEEATDRRTRADARRAGWRRNLAEGFRPASVAAVPRSAARLGVIEKGADLD